MSTQLLKPPGLCPVCGVFIPFDARRPNALHICPGRRVTPTGLGEGYGRLLVLVDQLKKAARAGEALDQAVMDELDGLLERHQDRYPKKRLSNWAKRLDNEKAITRLAEAGAIVLRAYSAYLQDGFADAVRSQFVTRRVDEETPCTCFLWHQREHQWHARFHVLGLSKPSGEVTGMTPFWDDTEAAAPPAILAGNYPPLNRSIEFPKPKLDTLVHEMIHWCTSVAYDKYTKDFKDNDRALVREGTTEWLKRNAMNDWKTGGYTDVIPRMREIIDGGAVTGEQLMHAYLGGRDVQRTVDAILAGYREGNRARADATTVAFKRSERERVGPLINTNPRFSVNRGLEFRETVARAFSDVDDATLAGLVQNAVWLKYLRARAAGADDAGGLAASRM